ncbi:hypothetical protein BDR26DRAFT_896836 [Obelidium mucronatum]|nr:hypothetical protein BDR26DRAFT_896836 [Obelidium mucronatum]
MYLRQHLQLYRDIRRVHKHLPPAMRFLGNKYVRDEWARHRAVLRDAAAAAALAGAQGSTAAAQGSTAQWLAAFVGEWTAYLATMRAQVADAAAWTAPRPQFGKPLDARALDEMSDQQLGARCQLHALKTEVFKEKS